MEEAFKKTAWPRARRSPAWMHLRHVGDWRRCQLQTRSRAVRRIEELDQRPVSGRGGPVVNRSCNANYISWGGRRRLHITSKQSVI